MFHKQSSSASGRFSWCRICVQANNDRINGEIAQFKKNLKIGRLCADCGLVCTDNNYPIFHYDHRDPSTKAFNISGKRFTNARGKAKFLAEIQKCDLRCANCHSIRSWRERHYGRPRKDYTIAA